MYCNVKMKYVMSVAPHTIFWGSSVFSFWGKFQRRQLGGSIFCRRSQIDDLGRFPGPPRAQPLTLSADQRECERVWGQNNRTPPQGSISKDIPQE